MTPSDLRALAARVEAGEECGYAIDCAVTWPEASPPVSAQHAIRSLDACAALQDAVLEDRWSSCLWPAGYVTPAEAVLISEGAQVARVSGSAGTLKRAWLAAILRALAVEMEAADDPA